MGTRFNMAENGADPRWDAVLKRAERATTAFVYAVRSTGIYCVPACPSVRPRRENVEFFDTSEAAQRAGYRACKRCRPDQGAEGPETVTLRAACARLSSEGSASSREIARELGLAPAYFQRFFKKHLGITPQQYRRRVLAERGREALARADSVTQSIYEAGFSSSSRFYENVARELGMTPGVARRGAPGERVDYVSCPCSLGWICIGWTARGVCHVALGEDSEGLVDELRSRFPRAVLRARARHAWATAIVRSVDRHVPVSVPLDIRATAFQARVWDALRRIPSGETRTYAQIAQQLGVPSATRAVASACARNSLALVVPCHRVVRSDGGLAGYRWGVERKARLLARERAAKGRE